MKLSALAAMWCSDPVFLAWLEALSGHAFTPDDAAEFVYLTCGIASRRDLDTNHHAARIFFEKIRTPFMAWRRRNPDEVAKY